MHPKPVVILTAILLCLPVGALTGQELAERPLQKLIDCPTAGGPPSGSFDFELRVFPEGGVLTGFTMGLFGRLSLGLYYGGTGVIGYSAPDWNPQPGAAAAFRLINESVLFPALALGFTSQGYGGWSEPDQRYQFKSKGFYAVTGKNFTWGPLGDLGAHFGVNRNTFEADDGKFDLFAALDYWMTPQLAVIAEYSAALDDWNADGSLGLGKGYLNAGLRWSFGERLAIDLHLRDILQNQPISIRHGAQIGREVRISYIEFIR